MITIKSSAEILSDPQQWAEEQLYAAEQRTINTGNEDKFSLRLYFLCRQTTILHTFLVTKRFFKRSFFACCRPLALGSHSLLCARSRSLVVTIVKQFFGPFVLARNENDTLLLSKVHICVCVRVSFFLAAFSRSLGRNPIRPRDEPHSALNSYSNPGNVICKCIVRAHAPLLFFEFRAAIILRIYCDSYFSHLLLGAHRACEWVCRETWNDERVQNG